MNHRESRLLQPEQLSLHAGTGYVLSAPVVPSLPDTPNPYPFLPPAIPAVKLPPKPNCKKNSALQKDSLIILRRGEISHIISEDYSYKTDSYYTILQMEMADKKILPSTSAVIDAFVVPICLERARLAGIPTCEWEISQVYVPLPAIIYGVNYFAATSDFVAVYDNEAAKEAVRHITNKGKYPFCYQKLGEGAEICRCTAIFGKTIGKNDRVTAMALKIYDLFAIPLVQMVLVRNGDHYALSSISAARYSRMTESERALLEAYLSHQEFL